MPLIFKLPGQNKSKIIDHLVGLIDIVPTICGMLDIEIPAQVQGKDLSEYFGKKQPAAGDRYIYCESLYPTKYNANTLLGVVTDRWKYIQTTVPELYNIAEDPGETSNLIQQEPQLARILQDRLKQILEQTVRTGKSGGKLELDSEATERLESLGYVAGAVVEDYEFDQSKDNPKDVIAFHNARLQARLLIYDKKYAEAQSICEKMAQERPDCYVPYLSLARIAMLRDDFSAAVPYYIKVIDLNPNRYEAYGNLATALIELGQHEEAVKHIEESIRLGPESALNHKNLGIALARQEKFDQAIKQYKESLRIKPDQPSVFSELGDAYYQQERIGLAVTNWAEALRLKQNEPIVLSNLARVKAVYKDEQFYDPNESLRLAQRACEFTGYKDPLTLDTLATAFAATQDYPAAVEVAEKALELAQSAEQSELAVEIEKRLELFKAGQPYRKVRQSKGATR